MRGATLDRRAFLGGAAALGVVACSGRSSDRPEAARTIPVPDLERDPFTLGVASGDPLPDRVMLWTRLALDPMASAPMPDVEVPVRWEIAEDNSFRDGRSGTVVTGPELGHAVRVDALGLKPSTDYVYRFRVGPFISPTGRTRTASAAGADLSSLRLAVTSCNAYQPGYYTTYRLLAGDDVDAVVFLGDYIYELAPGGVRHHGLPPAETLDDFRRFYAVHHADPDLQAAHAAFPWIITWDDHEVEDNYAGFEPGGVGEARDPDARSTFRAKRAAAYRAWWENLPVRVDPPDADGAMTIYRSFDFGKLARVVAVDNRQYRSPIPRGEGNAHLPRPAGGGPQLEQAFDPDATMYGADQEAWLVDQLDSSEARWNLLAQQTILAECDRDPADPARGYSSDAWDGYVAARNRLLGHVGSAPIRNFVAFSGDIHTSAVTDLVADYKDPGSPLVGTELIAPSAASIELISPELVEGSRSNRHIHLYDIERRGYLRCDFSRQRLHAQFKYVSTTAERLATAVEGTAWSVADGVPGARPA